MSNETAVEEKKAKPETPAIPVYKKRAAKHQVLAILKLAGKHLALQELTIVGASPTSVDRRLRELRTAGLVTSRTREKTNYNEWAAV